VGTAPTSGLWFQITGGNLQYCFANNAAATCTTATALTNNTWANIEIRLNNDTHNSATFYWSIGGTTGSATIGSTFDAGGTNPLSPGSSCVTTTTTAQNCYVDYIQWSGFNQSGDGIRD
jgi:hypothetical protein